MTDKQIITLEGKSIVEFFEQAVENKKLKDMLYAKEQECEELKTKLLNLLGKEGLRQSEKEFYEQQLDQLKAENNLLRQAHKTEQDRRRAYENALTEIKEIAEKAREDLYTCESIFYADDDLREILQKISEVEND